MTKHNLSDNECVKILQNRRIFLKFEIKRYLNMIRKTNKDKYFNLFYFFQMFLHWLKQSLTNCSASKHFVINCVTYFSSIIIFFQFYNISTSIWHHFHLNDLLTFELESILLRDDDSVLVDDLYWVINC